jgi:hypothetical protein
LAARKSIYKLCVEPILLSFPITPTSIQISSFACYALVTRYHSSRAGDKLHWQLARAFINCVDDGDDDDNGDDKDNENVNDDVDNNVDANNNADKDDDDDDDIIDDNHAFEPITPGEANQALMELGASKSKTHTRVFSVFKMFNC